VITLLTAGKARSWEGIEAKASALRQRQLIEDYSRALPLAASLADDIARLAPSQPAEHPFDATAVIETAGDDVILAAAREHPTITKRINDDSAATDDSPRLQELSDRQGALEEVLCETEARSLEGIKAKADVLRSMLVADGLRGPDGDDIGALTWSIVRDLERLPASAAPAPAEQNDASQCPVEPLAREMGRLVERHYTREGAHSDDPEEQVRRERDLAELQDRIDAIADAASSVEAASLAGAMFQIMIAFTHVDIRANSDMSKYQHEKMLRRIDRCLYSVRNVLEPLAGVSAEQIGSRYWMADYTDPFRVSEN
jgi:hypothetical protein